MKILVTGGGSSGSWQIRGAQLGSAIGATVQVDASQELIGKHDIVVLVKRHKDGLLNRLQKKRVVWDIVDSYPQPVGNLWDRFACMSWLESKLRLIKPVAVVAATEVMAKDCESLGYKAICIPHHARQGLKRTGIRPMRVVGYEGGLQHLGAWRHWLEEQCKRRGWVFVPQAAALNDLDIVVALREYNGYASRNYKSNVKLANAQASGTPIICNRAAGYQETASGGEFWADDSQEVCAAFDDLEGVSARKHVSDMLYGSQPSLEAMATKYVTWLKSL